MVGSRRDVAAARNDPKKRRLLPPRFLLGPRKHCRWEYLLSLNSYVSSYLLLLHCCRATAALLPRYCRATAPLLSRAPTAHAGVVGMLTKISRSRDACVLLDDLLRISGALGIEGQSVVLTHT